MFEINVQFPLRTVFRDILLEVFRFHRGCTCFFASKFYIHWRRLLNRSLCFCDVIASQQFCRKICLYLLIRLSATSLAFGLILMEKACLFNATKHLGRCNVKSQPI